MTQDSTPANPEAFSKLLRELRLVRRRRKMELAGTTRIRQSLSAIERRSILSKTAGRCHICGGIIAGVWHADHVLPHSSGGAHAVDNYLPSHALCNNYRWNYTAAEFQQILKLGVWLRTQIERKNLLGMKAAKNYLAYEKARVGRQKQR
ncbi:MAG: HNH endonuclease [Betaproteobacteria bacterium]